MMSFLKFHKNKLIFLLTIFFVVYLSYGAMVHMYFWEDDNATIFKVQNIEGAAGNFGTGLYDRSSAYRGVAALVYPFYLLFGTEPRGYYVVGIIFYFLASLSFYFLARVLFKEKKLAFWSSLIFAAGYIGAESIWRVSTSLQTSHMLIAMNLSLAFYVLSFKSKKFFYFILSLLFFIYTIETGFVRAHGVIYLILGLEFLLNFKWLKSILRVIPFLLAFRYFYADSRSGEWVTRLFDKIIKDGDYSILLAPLEQLKNIIIPDIFLVPVWIFLLGLIFILIWKKNHFLWLGLVFMMAPILVPFITTGGQVFESTDRYITTSIVGFSIFTAVLFKEIFLNSELKLLHSSKKFYLACLVIIISHVLLNNLAETKIIQDRGVSSRRFYEQLKKEIPSLPKGSAIYFDVRANQKSNAQIGAALAVGSMNVTTSIALHYGIDRFDLYLPETFQETLGLIKDGKVTKDKLYTFFYDADKGLTNTTYKTRKALWGGSEEKSPISSLLLQFRLISSIDNNQIKFTDKKLDLNKYLNYLSSRKSFYKNVEATTSSQWKYHEIENLTDDNIDSSWLAHRLKWHYKEKTEIILDMKSPKNISGVYFMAGHINKIPTEYTYSCSINGQEYNEIKYSPTKKEKLNVLDSFTPILCRYLKMEIVDTSAHDEPQIAEMEVIEAGFEDIDFDLARKIEKNPFDFISSELDKAMVQKYLENNKYKAQICFETNKYDDISQNCQPLEIPVGVEENIEVIIPQGGTVLKDIKLMTPPPLSTDMFDILMRPLTFEELKIRNYIFEYSKN